MEKETVLAHIAKNLTDEQNADVLEYIRDLEADKDALRKLINETGRERDEQRATAEQLQRTVAEQSEVLLKREETVDDLKAKVVSLEKAVAEYEHAELAVDYADIAMKLRLYGLKTCERATDEAQCRIGAEFIKIARKIDIERSLEWIDSL